MQYKTKLILLLALNFALAMILPLSFIFDPARRDSLSFAFLDRNLAGLADGIEIYGPAGAVVLSRVNGLWVSLAEPEGYTAESRGPAAGGPQMSAPRARETPGRRGFPVKQGRVDDFFAALSRKEAYRSQAVSPEGLERLGLAEGRASRIVIRGGAGLPLLDLLIGAGDALGREAYVRRFGENEVYSGEDRLTFFIDSGPASWYDLRLFRAGASGVDAAMVQQAEIGFIDDDGEARSFVLRRGGNGWVFPGNESEIPDASRVEAWLRSALEAEGANFAAAPPPTVEGSVALRLGDGSVYTIQAGPMDEEKRRAVNVSGSEFVYALGEWTLRRLFRERSYFLETAAQL